MEQLFLEVLNRSFDVIWMILAVILLRVLLKKAPKWTICLLWGFVAARLIFPFHIESTFSLMPDMPDIDTVPTNTTQSVASDITNRIQAVGNTVNWIGEENLKSAPTMGAGLLQAWPAACSIIWIIGVVVMLFYMLANFLLLKRKVSVSIKVSNHVYICDGLESPFIFGMLCPGIYLPSEIDAVTAEYVLAHERTHLKRWDHVWKPLGFFILSIYWFHPLCWAAYILLCQDIEYACDEKTVKDMDKNRRADYCQALLTCSINKRNITAYPVPFCKTGVKKRIKSVIHYKKPAFWVVAASLAVCALTAACFMIEPKAEWHAQEKQERETKNSMTISRQKVESIVGHTVSMSREGWQKASISYIDNQKTGWDYFSENPWETDMQRDRLAQAALQELYTLTGYQVKECVYTTNGRSMFIFGKSAEAIKKSTVFYIRDYGWTLSGDSVPYMKLLNTGHAQYSDVQQIDSPYHDPKYQGHGAIPAWFLDYSGVYQGQKIKGYDAFDLEDMRFSHVKLYFDGGYYIVVTDDDIESVNEISGPYYETNEKHNVATSDDKSTKDDDVKGQSEE